MGLKLEIDASELEKAARDLGAIEIRASDIREAGEGIRLIMQEDTDFRFQNAPATETGGQVYGGVRWAELSESYLANNPRRLGGQILRDTGELQQSLTASGHPYNVYNVAKDSLVFGTALAKAGRLQRKRAFLFWHPTLLEKVARFLVNYIGG